MAGRKENTFQYFFTRNGPANQYIPQESMFLLFLLFPFYKNIVCCSPLKFLFAFKDASLSFFSLTHKFQERCQHNACQDAVLLNCNRYHITFNFPIYPHCLTGKVNQGKAVYLLVLSFKQFSFNTKFMDLNIYCGTIFVDYLDQLTIFYMEHTKKVLVCLCVHF